MPHTNGGPWSTATFYRGGIPVELYDLFKISDPERRSEQAAADTLNEFFPIVDINDIDAVLGQD